MISSCELHTRILVEEMEKIIREKEIAARFVEEIISPLVDSLKEMPNQYPIGISDGEVLWSSNFQTVYGLTYRGNKKIDFVRKGLFYTMELLKLTYVNEILKDYGFYINTVPIKVCVTQYTTSVSARYLEGNEWQLNAICPLREKEGI